MAQPIEFAREDIQALVEQIRTDPVTQEASQTVQVLLSLVLSLNGLPPQTFDIFSWLKAAGPLAPLLLYRCEEQHLSIFLELFDGLATSWSLLPLEAWTSAFNAQGHYLVGKLDDPQWALASIADRQNEIAARAPQLAPHVCRNFVPLSWDEIRAHFTGHTSEAINTDRGGFNPFRPAFSDLLPRENFAEALMRVFDAPIAAALASLGRIELNLEQILTVKGVERRHPDYFAKAYGHFLTERKHGN